MNYRAEYKYHIMNTSNGKLTYSTDDPVLAETKARDYCNNSGFTFVVLEAVKAYRVKRTVEIVESEI